MVFDEEGLEVGVVYKGRALRLRKRKEKQEDCFDFPVEWQPANQPADEIFKSDESPNYCPILGSSLQLGLWYRMLREKLERGEARQEKCEPGA